MQKEHPYAPPESEIEADKPASPIRMAAIWTAFAVTSPITPILLSVVVLVVGLFFSDPEDTGTPIGIILVPILLLTAGIVFAYIATLFFAMPVVIILRKRDQLKLSNLCWMAAVYSVLFGTLLVVLPTRSGEVPGDGSLQSIIFAMLIASAGIGVFLLIQAMAFWSVMTRLGKR
ncbi:MAG: hypothetical protein AAF483_07415 [Planctomycetota bacterium]